MKLMRRRRLVRRQLERKWLKTKSKADHVKYKDHCQAMYKNIRTERLLYNQSEIEKSEKDYKKMSSLTNHLLGKSTNYILPKSIPKEHLPDVFADFFLDKIRKIQRDIQLNKMSQIETAESLLLTLDSQTTKLNFFVLTDYDEMSIILNSMANKQCLLDPVPMWFIKENISQFLPLIVRTVNSSLSSGTVATSLKTALVRPDYKKASLDSEILKSYRPVSNLPILAKVTEKVVFKRLDTHIQVNDLLDPNQSAYRKCHSTETCLLQLQNDILNELDKNKTVAVVMLDMSAAFDTVSHDKLIKCFKDKFGIGGIALDWLKSYLTDRKQIVVIDDVLSKPYDLEYGFPQGAVLAGLFYNMYSADLKEIPKKYPAVKHKGYADDNYWYVAFSKKNTVENMKQLEDCIADAKIWMTNNDFKVNAGKTEIVYFTPQKRPYSGPFLNIVSDSDKPTNIVESLGVQLDQCMTMESQVNAVTKSVYFHTRNISKIRKYLTLNSAKTLVQSLVISRLDYANSLFRNLTLRLTKKLQRAQNSAARMLFKKSKRCHITPVLKKLHWLPVLYRIKFKIVLLVYKCLKKLAPVYLQDSIKIHTRSRTLRSNAALEGTLVVPRHRRRKFGGRAFSNVAAVLWNSLPTDIRKADSVSHFKTMLKTHFFALHFTC